jgi:hypothetical protein
MLQRPVLPVVDREFDALENIQDALRAFHLPTRSAR